MGCATVLTDCIRVDARVPYSIDLTLFCSSLWRAGAIVAAAARVRPIRQRGFEFEAQNAGQTGAREPNWPKALGQTITDGGVTWIAREISTNSLQKAIVSVDWEAPPEVVVSGDSIVVAGGEQSIAAYLQPSAPGLYTIIAWVTFSDSPSHREGFAIELEVR